MTYQGIIERVRAATGADRRIDAEILCACILPQDRGNKRTPAYTGSINAALALAEKVLPGWRYDLHSPRFATPFEAVLMDGDDPSRKIVVAEARTAPLALILATLLALQSQEPK